MKESLVDIERFATLSPRATQTWPLCGGFARFFIFGGDATTTAGEPHGGAQLQREEVEFICSSESSISCATQMTSDHHRCRRQCRVGPGPANQARPKTGVAEPFPVRLSWTMRAHVTKFVACVLGAEGIRTLRLCLAAAATSRGHWSGGV